MGERYELSLPYTPLGAPSRAYLENYDRIFSKNKGLDEAPAVEGGGGTRVGTSGGSEEAATPRLTPEPGNAREPADANQPVEYPGGHDFTCPSLSDAGPCDCGGPLEAGLGPHNDAAFAPDGGWPSDRDACGRCGDLDRPCACRLSPQHAPAPEGWDG